MLKLLLHSAVVSMLLAIGLRVQADEETIALDRLPAPVLSMVKKKYPTAEIVEAIRESDNEILYEVVVELDGKRIEVTLTPEGKIELIEKEIMAVELPKVVTDKLNAKFPNAIYEKIEAVYELEDGQEELDYYEVTLKPTIGESVEVEIDEEGEIEQPEAGTVWTNDFSSEKHVLASVGRNPYMILEPGYRLELASEDEKLAITVLNETKIVDGVETRIVEERESKNGQIVEVSRNFFAISKVTNNVYYFGEEVDMYKDGTVTGHEGASLSGVAGAKFGLAMPSLPLIGAKYQQETAPKIAMDRAEITMVDAVVKVTAGEFNHCLVVTESTPLEPGNLEEKHYAPGIGLLTDGNMKLVRYGTVER